MSHLTNKQREKIYALKLDGYSQAEIGKAIGCDQSTISRELSRNIAGKRLGYLPDRADKQARGRRARAKKKVSQWSDHAPLLEYVLTKLTGSEYFSPEQISGRIKLDCPEDKQMRVSHESIYQYIWKDKRKGGTLYKNLRCSRKKRKKRYGKKDTRGIIPNRKSIDERPKDVDKKKKPGHWESDLVVGPNGAIATFVERITKKLKAIKIARRTASLMVKATERAFEGEPAKLKRTMTHDNGKEIAEHEEITRRTGIEVYCANPYRSWERGLNENTNGLLRQYFPKKTDFAKVTQADVDRAVESINNRPRKTLHYRTPNEVYEEIKLCVSD